MPEIKLGQIWRELDPRFERRVEIVGCWPGDPHVTIVTVGAEKRVPRQAKRSRFNGKRGGYELEG